MKAEGEQLEPGAAGWKAQTNPLSYGGTPSYKAFTTIKQHASGVLELIKSYFMVVIACFITWVTDASGTQVS